MEISLEKDTLVMSNHYDSRSPRQKNSTYIVHQQFDTHKTNVLFINRVDT